MSAGGWGVGLGLLGVRSLPGRCDLLVAVGGCVKRCFTVAIGAGAMEDASVCRFLGRGSSFERRFTSTGRFGNFVHEVRSQKMLARVVGGIGISASGGDFCR